MDIKSRLRIPVEYRDVVETREIEICFKGLPMVNDDEICQSGECSGCEVMIHASRKVVYCPNCGTLIGLT